MGRVRGRAGRAEQPPGKMNEPRAPDEWRLLKDISGGRNRGEMKELKQ